MLFKYKIFLITFFCVVGFQCKSNNDIKRNSNNKTLNYNCDTDTLNCLKRIIVEYEQSTDSSLLVVFFNYFPNSFIQFKMYYGFEKNGNDFIFGPLNNDYYKHVQLFFRSYDYVIPEKFINKLLNIAIGGELQVDAVNILKHNLIEFANKDPNLFCFYLEKRNDIEIESILKFVLSDIHGQTNEAAKQLQISIRKYSNRFDNILFSIQK